MSKAIAASAHSVLEVEGAAQVQQTIETLPSGDARCITTAWRNPEGTVLRQDQCIVVDRMPAIGGAV